MIFNNKKMIINKKLFSEQIIMATAVRFIDIFFIQLKDQGKTIEVSFEFKDKDLPRKKSNIKKEFANELIFQKVRANVSKQNREIRELIISKAIVGADPKIAQEYADLMSNDSKIPDNPLDVFEV